MLSKNLEKLRVDVEDGRRSVVQGLKESRDHRLILRNILKLIGGARR
jgi:hypothetical protein